MSSQQLAAKPPKIPVYLKIHRSVNKLYRGLRNTKDNYLGDEQARDLGIEFSRLNLNNAEKAESESVCYFLPADPDKFNIAATGIKFDEFAEFPSSYSKELWGRLNCLVGAYMDYESALWDKNRPPSETVMDAGFKAGSRGSIYHGTAITDLEGAMEYKGDRRSHRVIILSGTKQADKNRVTMSELEILISWVNLLVISFLNPSHARIIQGHFSDGKLHAQFSELLDFDVPNYTDVTNYLLRWAHPILQGGTVFPGKYTKKASQTRRNTPEAIPPTPSASSAQPEPSISNPPIFTLVERPENIRRTSPRKYQPYDRHHESRGRCSHDNDENTRPR